MRVPSAIAGVLSVPVLYLRVRRVSGQLPASIAALMLALSGPAMVMSHNARGYIFAQLFALLAALATTEILQAANGRRPSLAWLATYTGAVAAAVYLHTTMVLLPFLLTLFALVQTFLAGTARSVLPRWIGANLVVVALWAWWGRITLMQGLHPPNVAWIPPTSMFTTVRVTFEAYVYEGGFRALPLAMGIIAVVLLGAAFAVGTWRSRSSPAAVLPWLATALPVSLHALSLISPMLLPRTLF